MDAILRISEAATLAFHAMTYMAQSSRNNLISVSQIAGDLCVSEAHLGKVLQRLAKFGLVSSKRGPKGGFILNREPQEITLLDIYQAIDGPLTPSNCLLGEPLCDGKSCILGGLLQAVNHLVYNYFNETSLAQITVHPKE